jgi:hypothetical protein
MSAQVSIFRNSVLAITAMVAIGAAASTSAAPGGGHFAVGGGGHFAGGGGFHGGYGGSYRGWGGHAYSGWHGYYGGWRGGYYGGWRGGWAGWRWGCCGWGWAYPWVGLGWYLPVLPWGYQTVWWDGVPYYYANNYYYAWNADAGQYEAVQPPAGVTTPSSSSSSTPRSDSSANTQGRWTDLFAYPKAGQSTDQQVRDRAECHKWVVEQTGFDPEQPSHDGPKDWAAKRDSYLRAEAACLTARNYSVK